MFEFVCTKQEKKKKNECLGDPPGEAPWVEGMCMMNNQVKQPGGLPWYYRGR